MGMLFKVLVRSSSRRHIYRCQAPTLNADGKVVYEPKAAEPTVKVPFLVNVGISDLNIRKGPGTDYGRVQFCPVGVYTIMEVKPGHGSKAGWGRLKSGIGWISLDFVKRL